MTQTPPSASAVTVVGEPDHADRARRVGDAVLSATRQLLWIKSPTEAAAITQRLIDELGGRVMPVSHAPDAIPVDVSFGEGVPVLPIADPATPARALLESILPTFMLDAQRALELAARTSRLAEDASIDPLTGLANRRMLGRALGRVQPEDTLVMIDLDHFKAVNDTLGHAEGDRVLVALGRTLATTVRGMDRAGRYGGEEFVVILGPGGDAETFLSRLRAEWERCRPHPITFSAGVAPGRPDPKRALEAADRAMYRAKAAGRNQWHHANREDYV